MSLPEHIFINLTGLLSLVSLTEHLNLTNYNNIIQYYKATVLLALAVTSYIFSVRFITSNDVRDGSCLL